MSLNSVRTLTGKVVGKIKPKGYWKISRKADLRHKMIKRDKSSSYVKQVLVA